MTNQRIELPRYTDCFVCGSENKAGFDVTFYVHNGRIETEFTPADHYCGFRDVTHGGVLATILDECMGWSCILARPIMCYTAEMTLRYRTHAVAGETLRVYGELVADKKRMIVARGSIERPNGELVCSGEGKYIPMPQEQFEQVVAYAGWNDRFQKVYEEIQRQVA
ncbi:PaaI family thioesterase [bacterium]|nr:PaaI family thioesterase [bacterium]